METTTTFIKNCARCEQEHGKITFQKFRNDIHLYDQEGDGPYNYWAMCPVLNEPILLVILGELH